MIRRPVVLLAVQVAAVTGILACLVALATRHPWRLDLTPERRFTLSPYTREVLGRLHDGVRVTVFYSAQAMALRHEMQELLALYREAQPRIRVRFLDLDRNPVVARHLDVSAYNTAVIEAGKRRRSLDRVTEETLTAALRAVAGTPPVVTYFVVGHGEHDPRDGDERRGASAAAHGLAAEGFDVRALAGAATLPADTDLVVLAGPTHDLAAAETAALAAWVRGGGALLVLADPGAPPGVAALTAGLGIELTGDLLVDERSRLFGTDGRSARVAYVNQTLVPTAPEAQALLPEAQSVRLVDAAGVHGDYLASTDEAVWADVDRRPCGEGDEDFRPGRDRRGPLPVAALADVPAPDGRRGRLLVVGDADFVTNLHLPVLGNREFLLLASGLLARGDAVAATRPPAAAGGTFSPLALSAREARLILWGAVVVPSALLAALGVGMARRSRGA